MSQVSVPVVSDRLPMPIIGYGTWQSKGLEFETGVKEALEAGYRHIDCAAVYENEHIIGEIIEDWISSGKLKREDLFIVSKLPPVAMRASNVQQYLDDTLKKLKLDYIDLYLVHTPFAFKEGPDLLPFNPDGTIAMDTTTDHLAVWKELENQVISGKTKAIGLSNFNIKQIQRILDNSKIKPTNLQIEMHLYLQQKNLVKFCNEKGITVTAYSPLGSRGSKQLFTALGVTKKLPDLLNQPKVIELAEKYKKSKSQILLKHLIQTGVAVIPKSLSPDHIRENIQILDFKLNEDEIKQLDGLDQGENGRILDFEMFKGISNHPEYPF